MARDIRLAVELYPQARVEKRVILKQRHYILVAEGIITENIGRGGKRHKRTVRLVSRFYRKILHKASQRETGPLALPIAVRRDLERCRQSIHRLDAHTVKSDSLGKGSLLELTARIHLRRHINHRPQRDTAAVVTHRRRHSVDSYRYTVAVAHHILIDRVVDHFLEQHIYAVVAVGAVAELADIHARTLLYVFVPRQREYRVIVVACSGLGAAFVVGRDIQDVLFVVHSLALVWWWEV